MLLAIGKPREGKELLRQVALREFYSKKETNFPFLQQVTGTTARVFDPVGHVLRCPRRGLGKQMKGSRLLGSLFDGSQGVRFGARKT